MGIEALLVAQPKVRFEFAVTDFQFPTLTCSKQQGFNRERQHPLTLGILDGIDPEVRGNVHTGQYEAGHMFYLDVQSLSKFKDDIIGFFNTAAGS